MTDARLEVLLIGQGISPHFSIIGNKTPSFDILDADDDGTKLCESTQAHRTSMLPPVGGDYFRFMEWKPRGHAPIAWNGRRITQVGNVTQCVAAQPGYVSYKKIRAAPTFLKSEEAVHRRMRNSNMSEDHSKNYQKVLETFTPGEVQALMAELGLGASYYALLDAEMSKHHPAFSGSQLRSHAIGGFTGQHLCKVLFGSEQGEEKRAWLELTESIRNILESNTKAIMKQKGLSLGLTRKRNAAVIVDNRALPQLPITPRSDEEQLGGTWILNRRMCRPSIRRMEHSFLS